MIMPSIASLEINLNNGGKCVLHELKIKTRFTNVYDDVWIINVHKCIVKFQDKHQNVTKCKTILQINTMQLE